MIAHPEVLVQLRNMLVVDVDSFNVLEDNTKHPDRLGCGGPPESSGRGMQEERRRRTREAPQAPERGKAMKPTELGHVRVKSPDTACARAEGPNRERSGRPEPAACERGVLSGIVVGGWESQPQGEGPDGSTQPAKETRAGHVGSEQYEPTSLRAIAKHRPRESEYYRGTGCGKTARPGLCRGRRVTGVPTAELLSGTSS